MSNISVIVPVYKVEPYLHRCIDSILAQTHTDFELIIVDDGSPDGCGTVCDEYALQDTRIIVFHQPNGGLSAARNTGIDYSFFCSDSEWLSFIDSDDWVHEKYFQALYRAVVECDCKVSICGYKTTEGESLVVDISALDATMWGVEEFFTQHTVNAIIAWGKLYNKRCFDSIRYPVGKIHEDEFVTYKILFQYPNVAVIDQPLYAYYQNPNGITGSGWKPQRINQFLAFEEQMHYFSQEGYELAYKYSVPRYLQNMAANVIMMKKNEEYDNLYFFYRKRLKKELKKNKKNFPINQHIWTYETAYPLEMRCYKYYRTFCSNVKDIGLLKTLLKCLKKMLFFI